MAVFSIILGIAATAGIAVFTKGALEATEEEKNKILKLNNEINSLIEKTKFNIEASVTKLNNANSSFVEAKKSVAENELKAFAEVLYKIHNIEEKEKISEAISFSDELNNHIAITGKKEKAVTFKPDASSDKSSTNTSFVSGVASAGMILKDFFGYHNSIKRQETLKETKKKIEFQREKALRKVAHINNITKKCNDAKRLLNNLAENLKAQTDKLSEIAQARDYDYQKFTDDEKNTAFVCINLAKTISDIIKIHFIFEDGKINLGAVDCVEIAKKCTCRG